MPTKNLINRRSSSVATSCKAFTSSTVYGFGSLSGISGQSCGFSSPVMVFSGLCFSIVVTVMRLDSTVHPAKPSLRSLSRNAIMSARSSSSTCCFAVQPIQRESSNFFPLIVFGTRLPSAHSASMYLSAASLILVKPGTGFSFAGDFDGGALYSASSRSAALRLAVVWSMPGGSVSHTR